MGYLTPRDYKKTIQADNLQQVIGSDPLILQDAEETAIERATTLLVQKYIITREFQDTPQWDKTDTYLTYNRVYLDAPVYATNISYAQGTYISFLTTGAKNYNIYRAIATNTTIGPFLQNEWALIGYQYDIYSVQPPKPEFNYNTVYNVGDQVYWNNKIYTCAIATAPLNQYDALQYGQIQNVPLLNVAPDDLVNGMQYWGAGVAYNVPPGIAIDNITYWTAGDSRSKLIVWGVVAITLYYVHDRIAPMNIPELRVKNYDEAIRMMKKDFSEGEATAINLQPIQPRTGCRIRYGGNVKNNNSY